MLGNPEQLEETYHQCLGAESLFERKAVLFIPSESYDAPTITVIEGLSQLGFKIFTIRKGNINSWFCNQVITDPTKLHFDFVLSNLHWGTRWDYYADFDLWDYPLVLIDGDDFGNLNWRQKHQLYSMHQYAPAPDESVMAKPLQPYRWMMPLGDYEPDVVFTSQKVAQDGRYLPFGIQKIQEVLGTKGNGRTIDFTNIGAKFGDSRHALTDFLDDDVLPGKVFNGFAKGSQLVPTRISNRVRYEDKNGNVHSWFRWKNYDEYWRVLNDSKVLIYPGVWLDRPQWDSKRPWEALAAGCLLMLERPNIDISEYPLTGLNDWCVYDDYGELVEKCQYLYRNPDKMDTWRKESVELGQRCFSPMAMARYFLRGIADEL